MKSSKSLTWLLALLAARWRSLYGATAVHVSVVDANWQPAMDGDPLLACPLYETIGGYAVEFSSADPVFCIIRER